MASSTFNLDGYIFEDDKKPNVFEAEYLEQILKKGEIFEGIEVLPFKVQREKRTNELECSGDPNFEKRSNQQREATTIPKTITAASDSRLDKQSPDKVKPKLEASPAIEREFKLPLPSRAQRTSRRLNRRVTDDNQADQVVSSKTAKKMNIEKKSISI